MKRNKLQVYVHVFLVLFTSLLKLNAQESKGISYQGFMTHVLENHPLAAKARNAKQYGELNYKAERGNYDPAISGGYQNKFYNETNYYSSLQSEIKQPIFTSQYLKLGYEYGVGTYLSPENSTPAIGLPYLGLEVGVLQGLIIDKRRADVLKSKEYMAYYSAEKDLQLNDLLFNSAQVYFDWLFTIRLMRLNAYFAQLAEQRLGGIKSLANIGERPTVDTVEAAIFLQSRTMDLQAAEIENQKVMNVLLSLSWNKNTQEAFSSTVLPNDSLENCYQLVKNKMIEKLYTDTFVNPIITQYSAKQNVLEIEKRLKKELIKPKLSVNYNFLSGNKTTIDPVFSNNNYKWGANLSFPLFLRNPVNEYKMAKIQVQNNQYEMVNKNNELKFKITAIKQNLSLIASQITNAERSVLYSKKLLDAERLKFENGESSLFMLNTRESKLLESEMKLAEYKLKFMKTSLSFIYTTGNLNYSL